MSSRGQNGRGNSGRGSSGNRGGRGRRRGQGRGGRGQPKGRNQPEGRDTKQKQQTQQKSNEGKDDHRRRVVLVLHGNRQTGQLLLGRMDRLKKRLSKEFGLGMVAPDAPFPFETGEEQTLKDDTYDNEEDRNLMLTWWKRQDDNYIGLEESLDTLMAIESDLNHNNGYHIVGILGFSQGARLAHLVTLLHHKNPAKYFTNLQFVILVAGYDAPVPPELVSYYMMDPASEGINDKVNGKEDDADKTSMVDYTVIIDSVESLHIWGQNDTLVLPSESQSLTNQYHSSRVRTYTHPGNHFVPMKGSDMDCYIDFISNVFKLGDQKCDIIDTSSGVESTIVETMTSVSEPSQEDESNSNQNSVVDANRQQQDQKPDDESAAMQREEVVALIAIFPGIIQMRSFVGRAGDNEKIIDPAKISDEDLFQFPIIYDIKMVQSEDGMESESSNQGTNWPKNPLTIRVQYPINYPEMTPTFKLIHENNIWEFPSSRVDKLITVLVQTATNEIGMPSILSCFYAAREYLDSDVDSNEDNTQPLTAGSSNVSAHSTNDDTNTYDVDESNKDDAYANLRVKKSTEEEIHNAVEEGLEIAESLLNLSTPSTSRHGPDGSRTSSSSTVSSNRKSGGGSFGTYTMGLVGKPSAGKSTFFNAATAFSRQRGQQQLADDNNHETPNESNEDVDWGGASMAAHPFTTIDPNIGYCLVPAPMGSCPEDYYSGDDDSGEPSSQKFGSTHGRDPSGRRLLPVLLKDVAGLVPGAYQGRGRGNQFLNDLTDATVLIHVVDASGTSDESGNKTVVNEKVGDDRLEGDEFTNPVDDLAWIRNEILEWIYHNVMAKWDVVSRKGKSKLAGMFSGYGQKEATVDRLLTSLEAYMNEKYGKDRIYDNMTDWTEADVHRLVSLFLGVRFPMALCLNKVDLPSAKQFVEQIQSLLPIHGAHASTALAAKEEMLFVRNHMRPHMKANADSQSVAHVKPPVGVWECLSSALMLHQPVLVFPVNDLSTLAPLPGLNKITVEDPSLPSKGMIRCITAAGGSAPTCWTMNGYTMPSHQSTKDRDKRITQRADQLRDVLLMRPGSTVEDVFFTLKRLGGLGGEFVRAEAFSGRPSGGKPKPIKKHEPITADTCVIKIMSNKRSAWQ